MVDVISKKPNPKTISRRGKGKRVYEYKDRVKKMKALGKLDIEDFKNVKEMGMFLDFHNNAIEEEKKKRGEEDIHEISKFVAKMMTRKTFL